MSSDCALNEYEAGCLISVFTLCLQSIFISRVTPEGAAERAGLRLGDKLLSVSAAQKSAFSRVTITLRLHDHRFLWSE